MSFKVPTHPCLSVDLFIKNEQEQMMITNIYLVHLQCNPLWFKYFIGNFKDASHILSFGAGWINFLKVSNEIFQTK